MHHTDYTNTEKQTCKKREVQNTEPTKPEENLIFNRPGVAGVVL